MSEVFISGKDVMEECHVEEISEFRRLLRRNGFSGLALDSSVDKGTANAIVHRLTGRQVDWYKYRQHARDALDEGPLTRGSSTETWKEISRWYAELISTDDSAAEIGDRLIGVGFQSGFLRGPGGMACLLPLKPGVNILIGDRGSGKSTALTMSGLLAASVSEQADELMARLVGSLADVTDMADLNRKARAALRRYGITKYAVFYQCESVRYSHSIDCESRIYEFLRLGPDGWRPTTGVPPMPPILLLRQGEVVRITDDSREYQLHTLLDAIFPATRAMRLTLSRRVQEVMRQERELTLSKRRVNRVAVERVLRQLRDEISFMWPDLRVGFVRTETVSDLYALMERLGQQRRAYSIEQVLEGQFAALFDFCIGALRSLLREAISDIESLLQSQSPPEIESIPSEGEPSPSEDDDLTPLGNELEDQALFEAALQNLDSSTLNSEKKSRAARRAVGVLGDLHSRISMRISAVQRIVDQVADQTAPSSAFIALGRSYAELQGARSALLVAEAEGCRQIADLMNRADTSIRLGSEETLAQARELEREADLCAEIAKRNEVMLSLNTRSQLIEWQRACESYESSVTAVRNSLDRLNGLDQQKAFVHGPMRIQLQQGSVFRDFDELSFGQKSAIVLQMALISTDRSVIIIDQPEDNLDTHSVVNILAPVLRSLKVDRQLILATHNSSLVMSLDNTNVVVMESLGEHGQIRMYGSSIDAYVVREMLEVLEGGIQTFDRKIRLYDEFIDKVTGLISDMKIAAIEQSFRRRTIDELRNFLQPIISDRALIVYARHQLRNELQKHGAARLRGQIDELAGAISLAKNDSGAPAVFERLQELMTGLDSHVRNLEQAIEQLRLMDTTPHPIVVDLYQVITSVREQILSRFPIEEREVSICVGDDIKGVRVWADPAHLTLVFQNLIRNSLRATEHQAIARFGRGEPTGVEMVSIDAESVTGHEVSVLVRDNGAGISPLVQRDLYRARCSTQVGGDHGLGGVIISKFLALNGGSVEIRESDTAGGGTVQRIRLTCADPGKLGESAKGRETDHVV